MSPIAIAGTLAVVVSLIQFVPQAVRVHRVGMAGVSLGTWATFSATTAAWLSYGVVAHQPSLTAVNLVTGPTTWSILARVARDPARRTRAVIAFILAAASAGVIALVPAPAVFVLAAVEVIAIVPQLVAAFVQTDLTGVSVTTWLATLVAQSLWGVYGAVAHQLAVCLGGFAGGALGAVVALRVAVVHRAARRNAR